MPQDTPAIVGVEREDDLFWPRLGEFAALYALLPSLLYWVKVPGLLIPGLMAGAVLCVGVLRRDPTFDRKRLWGGMRGQWRSILVLFGIGGVALTAGLLVIDRGSLFAFPLNKPVVWAIVMVFYPLVSVYPQEVIYRAFLMHRYGSVFGSGWTMIAASAAAFGFGHILFENSLAVVLTLLGGVLFAYRYHCSRALLPVVVEHAMYGCLIFTVGLGESFYLGATR